jgi:hypothetical protein
LELIRELQKQFPISRAHMKLRLVVPLIQSQSLLTTLDSWNARVEAKDEMNGVTSVVMVHYLRNKQSLFWPHILLTKTDIVQYC